MQTRQTTTLPCEQFTVGKGNWNADRGPIQSIVLHTMVGTVAGANARFNTLDSKVSAQYGIGLDGKLYQWVDEDNVAFHAGNYLINQTSIGIEHEDGTSPQNPTAYNDLRPDVLYETSAKLIADICRFYDFPADKDHIFRHQDVIDKTYYPGGTSCPDALDTDRIIAMAAAILNPPPLPVTPPETSPVTPAAPVVPQQPVTIATPPVAQVVSSTSSNTPSQTSSTNPEANLATSGQAGKVPLLVESPILSANQPKPQIFKGIIDLIVSLLHFIGIEKKVN